jgi:hypothetical protein
MERWLPLSLLLFALFVQACSTETAPTDPVEPAPVTGEILGLVTGDGAPRSGVTVNLSRNGSEVATVLTTGNGEFGFTGLGAGTYAVAISEIAGMICSRRLTATVVAGEETEVSFACITVGTVEGRVTVNGVGAAGILVAMRNATRHLGTKPTAKDGTYRFTNVSTGAKTVWIITEEPCPGTQQENTRRQIEVTVSAGGVAVADFSCTGQVVTGRVTVNGIGEPGLTVLVCYGSPVWDYGCVAPYQATDSEGHFAYTSVHAGSYLPPQDYLVFVESPFGMSCPERPNVPVPAGAAVTVDFPCVRS